MRRGLLTTLTFVGAGVLAASTPVIGPNAQQGIEFEVRLLSHLTSYRSRPGEMFRTVVTTPVRNGAGELVLPAGAIVNGMVRKARRVGMGLVHERASLEIEFTSWEPAESGAAPPQTIRAELVEIDNARETVRGGRIQGVLATDSAQSLVQGFWRTPSTGLFRRAASGLSGATSVMWNGIGFAPASIAGIFALRCMVFRWPEPEIHLTPGVDMKLRLADHSAPPPAAVLSGQASTDPVLNMLATSLPIKTTRDNGKPTDDIINLLIAGTQDEVEQAFLGAGWYPAEKLTRRSMIRIYRAVTSQRGYPTQPVSVLHWQGRPPDITFQRSFNTVSKRHHVRLWRLTAEDATFRGETLWAAAATHDVGIRMDLFMLGMTHEIDPRIDQERDKVISDLAFSGCLADRQFVSRQITAAPGVTTDGRLAFIALQPCASPDRFNELAAASHPRPPGNRVTRLVRRLTLEARHSLLRGNMYYLGYRFVRDGVVRPLRITRNTERRTLTAAATMPPDAVAP